MLEHYLPSSGPILVTTRYSDVASSVASIGGKLELDLFNDQESAHVFRSWRSFYDEKADPIGEEKETEELLGKMGGLALGVSQMAAYIGRQQYKVGDFLKSYEEISPVMYRTPSRGNKSLATVFEIHFKAIQDTNASQMLGLLSLLSPEVVPIDIFSTRDFPSREKSLMSDFAPWTGDREL